MLGAMLGDEIGMRLVGAEKAEEDVWLSLWLWLELICGDTVPVTVTVDAKAVVVKVETGRL